LLEESWNETLTWRTSISEFSALAARDLDCLHCPNDAARVVE